MHKDGSLRAITYQINLYDISLNMYISIVALIEVSPAGFWHGAKYEIIPYYIPLAIESPLEALLILRIFALIWLIINTGVTLSKNESINEVFSQQSFWDVCWSMTLIGL